MKQEVTVSDLLKIGFKKKTVDYKDLDGKIHEAIIYELKGRANDRIYFNSGNPVYTFYYETTIGSGKNGVHLLINKIPELMLVLQVFQIPNDFFKERSKR